MPVWVLATPSVVSLAYGHPELLQGTVIDITAQKKAQASFASIKEVTSSASRPEREKVQKAALSQRLAILLQRASQALQPDNLPRMRRPEIQEFVIVLEEMKMLMSELEVLRLFSEETATRSRREGQRLAEGKFDEVLRRLAQQPARTGIRAFSISVYLPLLTRYGQKL